MTVAGVTKSFDGAHTVLGGVDLSVTGGTTTALLGPSGCGKTTLLRIIAGLETADSGTVAVAERIVSGPGVFVAPERRRVGMVFQDWALFPHLSVERNVGFGLPRAQRRSSARIQEALDLVGLVGMGERMPSSLSGGQRQRVALARAIAPRPSVLLLDEPFSNLDAALRVQVRTEVHALLTGLEVTTVFVTHDQDEAFVLGDQVAVLSEGRIVQAGRPEELYRRPATRWLAGFVGDANFVPGRGTGDTASTVLGPLPIEPCRSGPLDVLVRPEELEVATGSAAVGVSGVDSGVEAEIELVEYVGHSTTYLVRADGLSLRFRTAEPPAWRRGDTVRLRHRGGPAQSFARAI